jgi:tight adherence protein B
MNIQLIAIFFLCLAMIGGVAYVFLDPILSGEKKAEKRKQAIQGPNGAARRVGTGSAEVSKREQVLASLKELDEKKAKSKSIPLGLRIEQAGLTWTKQTFYIVSLMSAVACGIGVFLGTGHPVVSAAALLIGGFGLPRFYLNRRRKKRLAAFANEFPNALDVINRGVKAGLPLNDCIRVIANEAAEPVRSEFRTVVETQAMGMSMAEAVTKIYDRMPCAEANFFGIVLTIQQKAGGNLAEALGNLSRVLRDRKKMRAKIKAVSTEAKASAMIIGALPIVVMALVYVTTPKYIALLWELNTGHILLAISAIWMSIGIFVMKKMINFDF